MLARKANLSVTGPASSSRYDAYARMDIGAKRARLQAIIAEKSFKYYPDGIKLSSGKVSNYFFNLKATMMDAEGINLLSDLLLDHLQTVNVRSIGGLVMGAVPLVNAVCVKSFGVFDVDTFFVRKEAKQHGIKQQVDGTLQPNSEVVIVDDVATTGGSVQIAIDAALERGCTIKHVWVIVDREEGATEKLASEGIVLRSLFKRSDFSK